MIRKKSEAERSVWFLTDSAVEDPELDAFNHRDIADQLSDIVQTIEAPATVGLLGAFGTGKSSIGRFLRRELAGHAKYQVLSFSAEKHSGEVARQRALVYSFAEALVEDAGVNDATVRRVLARVEHDEDHEGPELGSLPISSYLDEHRDRILPALAWALSVAMVLWVLAGLGAIGVRLVSDAEPNPLWWPVTTPFLAVVLAPAVGTGAVHLLSGWLKEALTPARRTRKRPRAEAADELERVFGDLARLVEKKLVIIVDDIDRLPPDEVLEALRTIKTFQSVPKDHPPIFVIACDEAIIEKAIARSDTRPSDSGTPKDAAEAFLNKLFTVRQPLPPHMKDDMESFARRTLENSGHAGIEALGDELTPVIQILIHDGVHDPRHVIRLLNTFFTDYRLARVREAENGRLGRGEVTGSPGLLARLAVLKADFCDAYTAVREDFELLTALDASAAGRNLSEEQERILKEPTAAKVQADQALLDFLRRTARYAPAAEVSLAPFFYLGQTPASRVLGSQKAEQIRRAMANNDVDTLRTELSDEAIAEAGIDHATSLLPSRFNPGLPLKNALRTAASVLPDLTEDHARRLAAEIAVTGLRYPDDLPPPEPLANVVRAADASHQPGLVAALVQFESLDSEGTDAERDERAAVIVKLAADRQGDNVLVEALCGYFKELPEERSWPSTGEAWIDRAEALSEPARNRVLGEEFYAAVCRLAVGAAPDSISSDLRGRYEGLLEVAPPEIRSSEQVLRSALAALEAEGVEPRWFALAPLRQLDVGSAWVAKLVPAILKAALAEEPEPHQEMLVEAAELLGELAGTAPEPFRSLRKPAGVDLDWLVAKVADLDEDDEEEPTLPIAAATLSSLATAGASTLATSMTSVLAKLAERRRPDDAGAAQVRELLLTALPSLEEPQGRELVDGLLEPIQQVAAIDGDAARFALDALRGLVEIAEAAPHLNTNAPTWIGTISGSGDANRLRTPMAGLAVLARAKVLGDNATPAMAALQRLPQHGEVAQQRAALGAAQISWPPEQRPEAASLIDAHWDVLTVTQRNEIVVGLSEWPPREDELGAAVAGRVVDHLLSDDSDTVLRERLERLWPGLGPERPRAAAALVDDVAFAARSIADFDAAELAEALRHASGSDRFGSMVAALRGAASEARDDAIERFLRDAAEGTAAAWRSDEVHAAVAAFNGYSERLGLSRAESFHSAIGGVRWWARRPTPSA